jgi:hypothetical protein
VAFTRHEPNDKSVFVVLSTGQAYRYGFGAEGPSGERFDSLNCTSAARFSDLSWHPGGVDWVVVSSGEGIGTGMSHTEWPGVHATTAVLDNDRIAALGEKELAVYDRRARATRFRVTTGPGHHVALLPGDRVAVIAGPRSPKLRIFDGGGAETFVTLSGGAFLKASPAGVLALGYGELSFFDPDKVRMVASGVSVAELAWLDDSTVAVIGTDRRSILIYDVRDIFERGRAMKIKPPKKSAAKSTSGS